MLKQQTMVQSWSNYPGLWKFKAIPNNCNVLENHCLMSSFSLTLTCTISPSITTDIESCSLFITQFSWLCSLKDPSTQLQLHNWHKRKLLVNRKELYLNSSTALYCNSKGVSITQTHYDLLHWEVFPPFWKFKIKVHLVSHCILISFVS